MRANRLIMLCGFVVLLSGVLLLTNHFFNVPSVGVLKMKIALGIGAVGLAAAIYRRLNPLSAQVGNCVAVMIGLDAREGVITAVTADGYQVSTSKGEVAIGRHDLLRVR